MLAAFALAATFAAVLLALSAWAIAPHSKRPGDIGRTAMHFVRAPFAGHLVIGDSRTYLAPAPDGAHFAGYGGATFASLERLTGLLCRLSGEQVTIALGVNDAKVDRYDAAASRAALAQILRTCRPRDLALAEIWPVEPDRSPGTPSYDMDAIAALNTVIAQEAAAVDVPVLPAPGLEPGFTFDGVHFTEAVSADYARALAGRASSRD